MFINIKFATSLASLIYSKKCHYCHIVGEEICETCAKKFTSSPVKIFKSELDVFAGIEYSPHFARVVLATKEDGNRIARGIMVKQLVQALVLALSSLAHLASKVNAADKGSSNIYIVPIPSRPSANRARGFQHSLVLANQLAKTFPSNKIIVVDCLTLRKRVRDQAGLNYKQRFRNVASAYAIKFNYQQRSLGELLSIGEHTIFILDDLVTTGATSAAANAALKGAKINISGVIASCATTGNFALR